MNKVHLFDYLDIIGRDLVLRRYANQDSRWTAQIESCEVKENGVLKGSYGDGKTPEEAISDYMNQISGKCLVLRARSDSRREFTVPTSVFYTKN